MIDLQSDETSSKNTCSNMGSTKPDKLYNKGTTAN